jgi:cell division transport system ATP-binding protein
MLRFEMVGLRYGRDGGAHRGAGVGPEVLHDISFHVPAGAFRWLLGPSGAGKTSMLRLLYLAVRPTSGRLSLLGTDVTAVPRRALPALRRRIGVVFQDFRLLPHLSTFDNVALPLRIAGRPEGQIRADVSELLRWVGLAQYLDTPPAALSGGEQQRVAIARAVISRPALLLADEPTGNLDDGQAERLMRLFKEMNRIGTTVIVATHNEALVARHPARALRLAQGRLVAADRNAGVDDGSSTQREARKLPEAEWVGAMAPSAGQSGGRDGLRASDAGATGRAERRAGWGDGSSQATADFGTKGGARAGPDAAPEGALEAEAAREPRTHE